MSRRRNDGDQEFGSDSFLDIIANIVGILIILIVVAGVKVARQAEESAAKIATTVAASEAAMELTRDTTDETNPTVWPWSEDTKTVSVVDSGQSAGLSIPGLPDTSINAFQEGDVPSESATPEFEQADELLKDSRTTLEDVERQLAALQAEYADAERLSAESEVELQSLNDQQLNREDGESLQKTRLMSIHRQQSELTQRVLFLSEATAKVDTEINLLNATLASSSNRQDYVKRALDDVARQTLQLREVLEMQSSPASVKRIQHRLSPVGRVVGAKENQLFFYMRNNRIAHAPLRQLENSAAESFRRHRSYVANVPDFSRTVPAIEGFQLTYTTNNRLKPVQRRRYGEPRYEVLVNAIVQPTDALRAEGIDHALLPGSRFRQLVESAPQNTAVTMFLYPGEFQHFGRLREFAHSLNLRVAAWPLEDGKPISMSLSGQGQQAVAQ